MNNLEIMQTIEQICFPYFKFNIEDFYGDRGSSIYPDIEELHTLFFKLQIINKTLIGKYKRQEYVDKIKELDIGDVYISHIQSFGTYILIQNIKYNN
jgi:hypothetical protein